MKPSEEFKRNFNLVMEYAGVTEAEAFYERERCLKNLVAAEICYANLVESIRLELTGVTLEDQREMIRQANAQ